MRSYTCRTFTGTNAAANKALHRTLENVGKIRAAPLRYVHGEAIRHLLERR